MMRDSANMLDFGFAFNDKDFSDRVLHLEIIPEETATRSNDSDSSVGVELKTLHISSPILAVNSPFFFKLFKTDMIESPQKDVTLRINSTEELTALMDVLSFIYNNTLSAKTSSDLLAVLMAADKFQVTSCMKYCIQLLLELPMSLDSAILYIDLPPSLLASEIVQPLLDASKKVLVAGYMDFSKSHEKAMELSLAAMEVVLGSDGLLVDSEDDVFEFILEWARAHYPTLEERREVFTKRLTPFIRFPYMSCLKLKEVLVCTDFDQEQVSKLVSEALICKVEVPYGQHLIAGGRAYVYPLVKVVQLEFPQPRCVVYFNLKKDECENLLASEGLDSQTFLLGGQSFFLSAHCKEEPHAFGLFVYWPKNSKTCTLDFDFAVMIKSSDDFQSKLSVKNHTLGGNGWGMPNLLGISWTDFMSDDSDYFINDILHLRAMLTLYNSQELTALREVLSFIYNNTLSAKTSSDLLAVLMDADKFQVTSCMKYCIQLLLELPMSLDSAILYIDLSPSLLASEIVQPLIDASKKVLVAGYMDFSKSQEKAMELSLAAIEVVLGSDGLLVDSEDDVFEFILEWARAHYPKLEERREMLTKRLTPFIRFPYMSCLKLKEVLVCTDFDHEQVSKLVSEALICKVEVPYGQHLHAGGRAYVYPLVKVVHLEFPRPRCVVYFNLKKDECENLLASKELNSQTFLVGGQLFFLAAQCNREEPRSFGLFLESVRK